jgi:hypothetical protein
LVGVLQLLILSSLRDYRIANVLARTSPIGSVISLDPGIDGSIELSLYWPEPTSYLVVRYNIWYHLVLVYIRKNISTGKMYLGLGWSAEAVVWVRYFTRSVYVTI